MRALLELVEIGALMAPTKDLQTKLDADSLAALRSASILRPTDHPGYEEISPSDFMRALRALYRIEGRGLPVPGVFDRTFQAIGWIRDEHGERAVVLVPNPALGLKIVLHYPARALILVPTARALTKKLRESHGPGRPVQIEALEEALTTEGGRLARGGRVLPEAAGFSRAPPPAPAPPADPPRAPRAQAVRITGVERWNQVRMCLVNATTIRLDIPGRSFRVTYVDLGMADARNREPTQLWEALVEFCEGNGYFKTRRFSGPKATKTMLSRLRKKLKGLFGLHERPFDYLAGMGWKARFRTRPDLPDDLDGTYDDD
jgi:hypothetical protein